MNTSDLIDSVLRSIAHSFYEGRPRDFFRDQTALTRAIARYGYECNARNWQFSPHEIRSELLEILRSMRERRAKISYLPIYLEGAVDRHIRCRAEELSALAKKISKISSDTVGKIKPAPVREATTVETLDALYRDLKRRKKTQKKSTPLKQLSLI